MEGSEQNYPSSLAVGVSSQAGAHARNFQREDSLHAKEMKIPVCLFFALLQKLASCTCKKWHPFIVLIARKGLLQNNGSKGTKRQAPGGFCATFTFTKTLGKLFENHDLIAETVDDNDICSHSPCKFNATAEEKEKTHPNCAVCRRSGFFKQICVAHFLFYLCFCVNTPSCHYISWKARLTRYYALLRSRYDNEESYVGWIKWFYPYVSSFVFRQGGQGWDNVNDKRHIF